jgi:hypothetical protein
LVLEGQFHSHERFFGRLPRFREGVGKHQSLVCDDFKIDAAIRELVAIRAA